MDLDEYTILVYKCLQYVKEHPEVETHAALKNDVFLDGLKLSLRPQSITATLICLCVNK